MEETLTDTSEERNLIACALKSQEAWIRVSDTVTVEDFSQPLNRCLWGLITEMREAGVNPSPVIIHDKLPQELKQEIDSIGGWSVINALTELPIDPSNVEYHAKKLHELTVLRRGRFAGEKIQDLAIRSSSSDIFLQKVDEIVNDIPGDVTTDITLLGSIAEEYVNDRKGHQQELPGITTGFTALDSITQGLQQGRLYVLGARTGIGKSVFHINLVKQLAVDQGIPVLYISTEQTQKDEISRLLSIVGQVREHMLNNGTFSNSIDQVARMSDAVDAVRTAPIFFSHDPMFSPEKIYRTIKKYVLTEGVKAVFFDYIRIPVSKIGSNDKWAMVGDFAYGLKAIASELNIPIVAAVQVNRDGSQQFRETGEIDGSSFALSDMIEQAASVAMILRPLNKKEKEKFSDNVERRMLTFSKNRHGPKGDKILFTLNDGFVRMQEVERIAPE
jgi:replicative DNA helicase